MALVVEKNAPPPLPHRRIGGTAVYMAPEHALGRALSRTGQDENAVAAFRKALQQDPDNLSILLDLGRQYNRQKQPGAAESCFAAALRLKPGFAAAHHAMEKICLETKDPVQAAIHLRAALAADANSVTALYDLGRACRMQNDLEGAASAFHRYLKFAAKDTSAYLALAEVLEAQGKQEAAGKYRLMAQELDSLPRPRQTTDGTADKTIA